VFGVLPFKFYLSSASHGSVRAPLPPSLILPTTPACLNQYHPPHLDLAPALFLLPSPPPSLLPPSPAVPVCVCATLSSSSSGTSSSPLPLAMLLPSLVADALSRNQGDSLRCCRFWRAVPMHQPQRKEHQANKHSSSSSSSSHVWMAERLSFPTQCEQQQQRKRDPHINPTSNDRGFTRALSLINHHLRR